MNYSELKKEFPQLRKQGIGRQSVWNSENLKAGFLAYKYIYGHFPSGVEIDEFNYLPSQRYFQKNDRPGLVSYRKILKLPISDYRKGKTGGNLRYKSTEKNKINEENMYNTLIDYFPHVLVHEQKTVLRKPQVVRADFCIYLSKSETIIIDVFETQTTQSLNTHINIKTKKYKPM